MSSFWIFPILFTVVQSQAPGTVDFTIFSWSGGNHYSISCTITCAYNSYTPGAHSDITLATNGNTCAGFTAVGPICNTIANDIPTVVSNARKAVIYQTQTLYGIPATQQTIVTDWTIVHFNAQAIGTYFEKIQNQAVNTLNFIGPLGSGSCTDWDLANYDTSTWTITNLMAAENCNVDGESSHYLPTFTEIYNDINNATTLTVQLVTSPYILYTLDISTQVQLQLCNMNLSPDCRTTTRTIPDSRSSSGYQNQFEPPSFSTGPTIQKIVFSEVTTELSNWNWWNNWNYQNSGGCKIECDWVDYAPPSGLQNSNAWLIYLSQNGSSCNGFLAVGSGCSISTGLIDALENLGPQAKVEIYQNTVYNGVYGVSYTLVTESARVALPGWNGAGGYITEEVTYPSYELSSTSNVLNFEGGSVSGFCSSWNLNTNGNSVSLWNLGNVRTSKCAQVDGTTLPSTTSSNVMGYFGNSATLTIGIPSSETTATIIDVTYVPLSILFSNSVASVFVSMGPYKTVQSADQPPQSCSIRFSLAESEQLDAFVFPSYCGGVVPQGKTSTDGRNVTARAASSVKPATICDLTKFDDCNMDFFGTIWTQQMESAVDNIEAMANSLFSPTIDYN